MSDCLEITADQLLPIFRYIFKDRCLPSLCSSDSCVVFALNVIDSLTVN